MSTSATIPYRFVGHHYPYDDKHLHIPCMGCPCGARITFTIVRKEGEPDMKVGMITHNRMLQGGLKREGVDGWLSDRSTGLYDCVAEMAKERRSDRNYGIIQAPDWHRND